MTKRKEKRKAQRKRDKVQKGAIKLTGEEKLEDIKHDKWYDVGGVKMLGATVHKLYQANKKPDIVIARNAQKSKP